MKLNVCLRYAAAGIAATIIAAPCFAATVIKKEAVASPSESGAGHTCSFRIYLDPTVLAISGCDLAVFYDTSKLGEMTVTNDTAQGSSSGWSAKMGNETTSTLKAGFDAYRAVLITTNTNLSNPGNLYQVSFTTKAGYAGSADAKIAVGDDPKNASDHLTDGNFSSVEHSFEN